MRTKKLEFDVNDVINLIQASIIASPIMQKCFTKFEVFSQIEFNSIILEISLSFIFTLTKCKILMEYDRYIFLIKFYV